MNKKELIKAVSQETRLSQRDCEKCLKALQHVVTGTLKKGEMITIVGFGRFYARFKPERCGINPSTGVPEVFPSRFIPSFKCSPVLKNKF